MSNDRTTLTAIVSAIALLVTNCYWWRRERTVRESLTVSRDREAKSTGTERELREVALAVDISPEALPEEIEQLRNRIATQEAELEQYSTRLGNSKARWGDLWQEALFTEAVDPDEPRVIGLVIPGGETDDARAAAKRAAEQDRWIAVVGAGGDGTFVVSVGEELTERFSAAELAGDLAEAVGGGAGGSPRLATGGSAAIEDLRPAIETLQRTIEGSETFDNECSAWRVPSD
jgi:alanyl-tRNA synthetase